MQHRHVARTRIGGTATAVCLAAAACSARDLNNDWDCIISLAVCRARFAEAIEIDR